MTVYLVRHGKAKSELEDPERALNSRGITETEKLAELLKPKKIMVDAIFHSGKTRAKQTAEIFSKSIESGDGPLFLEGLNPNDDVISIYDFILSENRDYMFVGHLPFMNYLCSILLTGDRNLNIVNFEASSIACLKKDDTDALFTLSWMLCPDLF